MATPLQLKDRSLNWNVTPSIICCAHATDKALAFLSVSQLNTWFINQSGYLGFYISTCASGLRCPLSCSQWSAVSVALRLFFFKDIFRLVKLVVHVAFWKSNVAARPSLFQSNFLTIWVQLPIVRMLVFCLSCQQISLSWVKKAQKKEKKKRSCV